MRGITAFGAVAALWLASATAGIAAPSLTVLCGVDEAWCAAMKKAYEAKAGIEISMTRRSTGDILNLIRAEKAAPSVDVWWGGTGDTHLQAGSENLLEPYQPTLERDMLPWAQNFFAISGGRSAGISGTTPASTSGSLTGLAFGCALMVGAASGTTVASFSSALLRIMFASATSSTMAASPNSPT